MAGVFFLYKLIGPVFWGLLPISLVSFQLVLFVAYSLWRGWEISDWVEVLLAHFKEVATVLGLLGSVYALTGSFQVDQVASAEVRNRLFAILSTGFYSTIAGVLVSLEATVGLAMMKRA